MTGICRPCRSECNVCMQLQSIRMGAMERALLIATTALAQISLGHVEEAGEMRRARIATARGIADQALEQINAINQGRA